MPYKPDAAPSLVGMMDGMTDTQTPPTMTGDEFAAGLAALDWRQVEFAVRAGVAPDTVNRWIHD